ncbi:MAG: hypothetical protein ABSD41_10940 [Candidatus Bathyarchaeia archaeon]
MPEPTTATQIVDNSSTHPRVPAQHLECPTMNSVTSVELARKLIELLELKPGEPFEIARTRDGSILVKRLQQ